MKFFVLLSLLFIFPLHAQKQSDAKTFLYDFLPGSYEILGRLPESDSLYSGTALIKEAENGLTVLYKIGTKEVAGTGEIENAAGGDASVLRVRFERDGKKYETTYLIQSDLDNYARLSGYVYQRKGTTNKPGLEVLFPKR